MRFCHAFPCLPAPRAGKPKTGTHQATTQRNATTDANMSLSLTALYSLLHVVTRSTPAMGLLPGVCHICRPCMPLRSACKFSCQSVSPYVPLRNAAGRALLGNQLSAASTSMDRQVSRDEKVIQDCIYRIGEVNNVPGVVRKALINFNVEGKQLGKVTPKVAQLLCDTLVDGESIFQLKGVANFGKLAALTLTEAAGEDVTSRSDAVMSVMQKLRGEKTIDFLKGWRDELYPISESFYDEPTLLVERAATPLLGTQDYGVHINGLVRDEKLGELKMWIARRSKNKSKYPGMLDHIVAGGQPAGMGLLDNVVKECEEEAGVPASLTRRLVKPAGAVSYESYQPYASVHDESGGHIDGVISRSLLFCYDMELPFDFVPTVVDGEVEEFFQASMQEVKQMTDPEFKDPFKPNCYPVIIDYLLRAGFIDPDTKGYLEVLRTLRSGYCG